MTDQRYTRRLTGATPEQIEAARQRYVADYFSPEAQAVIIAQPDGFASHQILVTLTAAADYLVPPGARIAEPEDLAAIRAALAVIAELPVRTWAAQGLTVAMIDRLVALVGEEDQL